MAAITDRTSTPYLYLTIDGVGAAVDAGGTLGAYRFSTVEPGFSHGGDWLPYLTDLPSALESELDPITGEVNTGQLKVSLVEGPGSTQFLTDLFATREQSQRGELAASVTAAAGQMDVHRRVGGVPTVGQVLAIGSERCRITAVSADTPAVGIDRLTVTRGYYGTTATAHNVAADRGDAEVRYRLHYLKGRRAQLRFNFVGDAEGSAVVVGSYLLDRVELASGGADRGARWSIILKGLEAYLDTEIGRYAWTGVSNNPFSNRRRGGLRIPRDDFDNRQLNVDLVVSGDLAGGLPDSEQPFDLHADANDGGYLNYGGCCVEYDRIGIDWQPWEDVDVTAWRIAATPLPTEDQNVVGVREVFPTDKALPHTAFKPDPNGADPPKASDHPIDIFLCLLTSTGLGTNFATGRTNYDVLPGRMWGGMPVSLVDIEAWEAMRARIPVVRMPNHVFFWDGPENLAEIASKKLLGPLGIAAVQSEAGLLKPVRISEVFPLDTATVLGTDDYIAGTEEFAWDMSGQVLSQTWEFDHEGPGGRAREIFRVLSPEARERFHNADDRPLLMKAEGLTRDSGADALILERAGFLQRHFLEPPPMVALDLNWQHMHIPLGEPVSLTHAFLPNPSTGTRGVTSQGFIVIKVRRNWRDAVAGRGRGGGVRVWLFWVGLDSPTLAHIAPSAEVAAGDAGTGTTVTVEENEFTNGESYGAVPEDDTDGFQAGGVGVGVTVILLDSDGALKSANTPRVTSTTSTTLVLSDVFRDGVGVEVARVAGDIIVYSGDTGATSYTVSAWFAHMQNHAAFADQVNETIGSTERVNHYGD